ncbi:hypothetical protein LCGC14_2752350, partial [marine sediment metagenome]
MSTTMYSVHPETGATVIHQLPFSRESKSLNVYLEKGFLFDPPVIEEVATDSPKLGRIIGSNEYICTKCNTVH